MTKRRIILISVLAAVFALGCILYFAVISPFINNDDGEKKLPPETQEGETLGTSDRYQIFKKISRDELQSISVTNENGSFEFYRDNNGEFQIRGHEGISYDLELFSELVASGGYPLAKLKVADNADRYGEYGLLEPAATWTITDTAGNSHTMRVGHRLLTDDGYYVCLEGRDAVYVLANSIKGSLLAPIEDFINPVIMVSCTQNDYYTIDNFTIMHGDEKFISFRLLGDKDKKNPESIAEAKVSYPAEYAANESELWTVYSSMSGLYGEDAVVLGADDGDYEEYGLLDPAYTVSFVYNKTAYVMFFSELGEDGYYYASSNVNPTVISRISESSVEFLSYDLFKWISVYPFGHYITQISGLSVDSGEREVSFSLKHFDDGSSNGGLAVTASDGTDFSSEAMVQNFRMFYRTLISVEMIDYTNITEAEKKAAVTEENKMFSFTYTTLSGSETEIAFYPYSTRRCLVTINGEGEFYVLIDRVEKLISDTQKLMTGVEIESFAKS